MQDDPYSLDRLNDLVQVEPVRWWPPAPFWYVVIALLITWVSYALLVALCRWIRNAHRRQAMRELDSLQDGLKRNPDWLIDVSTILKRVALVSFPRERVASLAGDDWLRFLSDTCDGVDFTKQPQRSLGFASFDTHTEAAESQSDQIVGLARAWVVGHRAETTP